MSSQRARLPSPIFAEVPGQSRGLVEVCSPTGFLLSTGGDTTRPASTVGMLLHLSPTESLEVRDAQLTEEPGGTWVELQGLDQTRRLGAWLTEQRTRSHIELALNRDVEALGRPVGLAAYRLPHVSLPELHLDQIDLTCHYLGRSLRTPLMISGMTGGAAEGGRMNKVLADTAQELGLSMGLGSQRAMLEDPSLTSSFQIRNRAPDVLLFANIGAVQLNMGVTADDCFRLVEAVEADILALHLNPLQEAVQPEGDRDFRGLWDKIASLTERAPVPVVLKETGAGISGPVATRAASTGVAGLDIGGLGGTSWGYLEGLRAADPERQTIGETFRNWGIPTTESLLACRDVDPDGRLPLIASGGLRTGLDAALCISLGADLCGYALPFARAAQGGAPALLGLGKRLIDELRIAMFLSGCSDTAELRALAPEVRASAKRGSR